MTQITLYSKNNCPQCKMTKRFLSEKNVSYIERNIDLEPEYIDMLKAQGFQSVPVVTTAEEVTIVGFRPDQLKELAVG